MDCGPTCSAVEFIYLELLLSNQTSQKCETETEIKQIREFQDTSILKF